jgi:hypothetical protein
MWIKDATVLLQSNPATHIRVLLTALRSARSSPKPYGGEHAANHYAPAVTFCRMATATSRIEICARVSAAPSPR